MRLLALSVLVGVCVLCARAGADSIVNDRSLDPIGTGQYRPTLALVTGSTSLANHLVCMWEQQKPALAREYHVTISAGVIADPSLTWVQHGTIPVPAGYDWIEDLKIGSPGANGPDPGAFVLIGQIRSSGVSPFIYGIASIRGHVSDENTLTWDTPQIVETFGSQTFRTIIIEALSLHVAPGTRVAYLSYVNTLAADNFIGWWFRRSNDLGQSWSAPMHAPGDSTARSGLFTIQSGAGAGDLRSFLTQGVGPDPQLTSFASADSGTTFASGEVVGTVPPDYMRSPHQLLNSGQPAIEYDRTGSLWSGSFYVGLTPQMLHATTFPDLGSSPSVSEVEPDNHFGQATAAAPGAVLRGIASPGSTPADTDMFAFTLAAGQSLMTVADSATSSVACTLFGTDGRSILTRTTGTQTPSELDFSALVAGVYYLAISPINGSLSSIFYRIRTVSASPPSGGSRDQRDAFVWRRPPSGSGWPTPVNASAQTTPAGYDEDGALLRADLDGYLYAGWYDWSAQPAREISRYVLARSSDGGSTWEGPAPITSANSDWTYVSYSQAGQSIFGPEQDVVTDGEDLYYAWTDVRNGDADVYSRTVRRGLQLLSVSPSTASVTPGQVLHLQLTTENLDDLFGWDLLLTAEAQPRSWPLSSSNPSLAAGATSALDLPVAIPDTAAAGSLQLHLLVRSALQPQTLYQAQDVPITVESVAAVEGETARLELAPVRPNPASSFADVTFSLSRPGRARLEIYGLDGRRVKQLEDGVLPAGRHTRLWNGTDASGSRVAAGEYFVRLEAERRSLPQRMVWIR